MSVHLISAYEAQLICIIMTLFKLELIRNFKFESLKTLFLEN
jgi:hypothetical protein